MIFANEWHHLRALALLLALLPSVTLCQLGSRRQLLQQLGGNNDILADMRITTDRLAQPFLKVKDVQSASSRDAQRLYEQASSVSAIAYLLFGAAEPLSKVPGSSSALLPYLTHTTLRVYTSKPGICSSTLVEQLYGLSQKLYGTPELQACHYDLYTALRVTLGWVASNVPLTFQEVPGQPSDTAAWPDVSAISDADFAAAVSKALQTRRGELTETAVLLSSGRCGLDVTAFAALVPSISSALLQLHADLPELQRLPEAFVSDIARRQSGVDTTNDDSRRRRAALQSDNFDDGDNDDDNNMATATENAPRRQERLGSIVAPNLVLSMPPADFKVQPPSALPKLLIPIAFHVMSYKDGSTTGPVGLEMSPQLAQRMIRIMNLWGKPANISFFLKDVRYNSSVYPYLRLKDRSAWLIMPDLSGACNGEYCLMTSDFVTSTAVDFPRTVNIYVASETSIAGFFGYVPGLPSSDVAPRMGFVCLTWDQFSNDNSAQAYNDGVQTLFHEMFHYLGLEHTFYKPDGAPLCMDGDGVTDTPAVKGPATSMKFIFSAAIPYCMDLYWNRFGGDMEGMFQRASITLGIPDLDKNAWADSCPKAPGYDELGNYMTYSFSVCFMPLGHFTLGQVERAHYLTSEYQPLMYAWAQYYAAQQAAPPPQLSPPLLNLSYSCRVSALTGCACKRSWQLGGRNYSYCDTLPTNISQLVCEVENPVACFQECKSKTNRRQQPCYVTCAGSPQLCKRPPTTPSGRAPSPPPPPRPPSPPPRPPPPPPATFPKECMVSVNGCACRRSWVFNEYMGNYCSPYGAKAVLRCVVTADCPSFYTTPLQRCSPQLNATYCA